MHQKFIYRYTQKAILYKLFHGYGSGDLFRLYILEGLGKYLMVRNSSYVRAYVIIIHYYSGIDRVEKR